MCKGRSQWTESTEETSPYDQKVDDFFGGINRVSDNLQEKTKRFLASHHDHESRWRSWYNRNRDVDNYMNKPYETRSETILGLPFGEERDLTLAEFLPRLGSSLFDMFDEAAGATPYGLYAYQTPSSRAYDTCVEKKGLSLWDSSGYWRCLFPNSAISPADLDIKRSRFPHKVLTKEDFEESDRVQNSGETIDLGIKGIFFKQYNDYLSWRSQNLRDKRSARQNDVLQPVAPKKQAELVEASESEKPSIIGTEIKSFMNSDENEITQKEVKTEYFSDGTSKTSNIVRKKPIGSDAWASVSESNGESTSGWFWN